MIIIKNRKELKSTYIGKKPKAKTIFIVFAVIWVCNGCYPKNKSDFVATKFVSDTTNLKLRQVVENLCKNQFIAVYYADSDWSFGSGNKIVKLYSSDSISIDERFYGAHPISIINWTDSTIIIKCSVSSGHGNQQYRKWYLNNSVDKNEKLGQYNLIYKKNY